MKEDAPAPKHPPAKRRLLERAPDLWLAIWANDSDLPEQERSRAQGERERRKQLRPDCIVGVLVDREDATPLQLEAMRAEFTKLKPTGIHHPWTTRRIAGTCRRAGAPVTVHRELRDVVLASTTILAAPRGLEDFRNRTPAWEAIHYAKHRKLPVRTILPNGQIEGE